MITTARQLKDLIRNLSKKKSADAQTLMRNYMMERFLERISLSEYKDKFILKGGMLVAAMVGLDARATMDLDATIKAANVSLRDVEMIISNIIAIPIDDGVSFRIKRISEIMEEADYPGVRVSMETKFDGVIIPLKIDISTGDVITPKEIRYRFNLMLEDRTIEVWAYNLETVLAEKLETVISRNVTNTRMRDFYDIYILQKLHGEQLNKEILWHALVATARKRGTLEQIESGDIREILNEIETSSVMENLWKAYQKNYSYAVDISWHIVMESVRYLYQIGCSVDF
ncbi:MAG: nucleotidyl transferase AbiEii/AbiGii toxin family protein [Lachnospiraceae bacterium]